MNQLTQNEHDMRAEALAMVTKMHNDLNDAQKLVAHLQADLNRETDRCVMIVEERDRYRADNALLRGLLTKACTTIANMGLLAREAETLVTMLAENGAKKTPELVQMLEKGN
jgi:hypothetical protein